MNRQTKAAVHAGPTEPTRLGSELDCSRAASNPGAVGEAILHPVALLSVIVLLLNDHWLKARFPGILTGKLSDFAGLVFFPLLLASIVDASSRGYLGRPANSRRTLVTSIIVTGVAFALVKTTSIGAESYRRIWALMQWPAHALIAHRIVGIGRVHLVRDVTDLTALPMLWVAYRLGRRRFP